MIGDLNGRIGLMNDNKNLITTPRTSTDQVLNKSGKELIEFCNQTSLIIVNGRLENGKSTFYALQNQEVRKSVVDYLITSESIYHCIKSFSIAEPILYTDHSPMKIEITIELKK